MPWVPIFLAAVQILAQASPAIIAQFHGGAHDTATKVGSALAVVNAVTSNLASGAEPLSGVPAIHPALAADAAALAASHAAANP